MTANIAGTKNGVPGLSATTHTQTGMNPSHPASTLAKKIEDIKFFDIVKPADMIDPISKHIFLNPIQLIPCGHTFSQQTLVKKYLENRVKTCPTCSVAYTSTVENVFLKSMMQSYSTLSIIPSRQIMEKMKDMYKKLADNSDNVQVKEAILQFSKGLVSAAITKMAEIMLQSANSDVYQPILHLMLDHAKKQVNHVFGNNPSSNTSMSASGNGDISSYSDSDAANGTVQNPAAVQNNPASVQNRAGTEVTSIAENTDQDSRRGIKRTLDNPTSLPQAKEARTEAAGNAPQPQRDTNAAKKTSANNNSVLELPQEDTLLKALKNGQLANLDPLIKATSVNFRDENGNRPLHWAILKYKMVDKLIKTISDQFPDLNAQNNDGETALHLAARMNKVGAIKQLRALGASTNIEDSMGRTPIALTYQNKTREALTENL